MSDTEFKNSVIVPKYEEGGVDIEMSHYDNRSSLQ